MAQWKNRDQYSDAPTFVVDAASGGSGQAQFGNTVFLVDGDEQAATDGIPTTGWVRRTVGYGYVSSLTLVDGGTGYANADVITIVAHEGANGEANVVTDGSGVITSVTLGVPGGKYNLAPNVVITTSGGSGANVVPVIGGRAGRVHFEVLATLKPGSITTDATDFANTSTDPVANTTGTADDTVLPDS